MGRPCATTGKAIWRQDGSDLILLPSGERGVWISTAPPLKWVYWVAGVFAILAMLLFVVCFIKAMLGTGFAETYSSMVGMARTGQVAGPLLMTTEELDIHELEASAREALHEATLRHGGIMECDDCADLYITVREALADSTVNPADLSWAEKALRTHMEDEEEQID